jgi:hypothetical protein
MLVAELDRDSGTCGALLLLFGEGGGRLLGEGGISARVCVRVNSVGEAGDGGGFCSWGWLISTRCLSVIDGEQAERTTR